VAKVVEYLLSKCKALYSNPSTTIAKKKKKEERKGGREGGDKGKEGREGGKLQGKCNVSTNKIKQSLRNHNVT
jgi:hypothetical protein